MQEPTKSRAAAVRDSIQAFNRGDASAYAAHYAEDAKLIGPLFPEPLIGRDAIEQVTVAMSQAFPGVQCTIVSLLEDANLVACELHIEGTHNGPLPTPNGELPATGRAVSFDVFEILEFDEKGLVAEHREYMDPGAVMAQLGVTT